MRGFGFNADPGPETTSVCERKSPDHLVQLVWWWEAGSFALRITYNAVSFHRFLCNYDSILLLTPRSLPRRPPIFFLGNDSYGDGACSDSESYTCAKFSCHVDWWSIETQQNPGKKTPRKDGSRCTSWATVLCYSLSFHFAVITSPPRTRMGKKKCTKDLVFSGGTDLFQIGI